MISFTILGEPASLKNSRSIVIIPRFSKKRGEKVPSPAVIKSKKALEYERTAQAQIPAEARQMLQGPVRVSIKIYYASERPDLDESALLDIMQAKFETVTTGYHKTAEGEYAKETERRCVRKGVYLNDRQCREKHIIHAIDKLNPRAEIEVEQLFAELPLEGAA